MLTWKLKKQLNIFVKEQIYDPLCYNFIILLKSKMRKLSKGVEFYSSRFSHSKQKSKRKSFFNEACTNQSKLRSNSYLKEKWQKHGKSILLAKSALTKQLDIYQWRCKTQFPIVKTRSVNIKYQLQNKSDFVEVEVVYQKCLKRLNDISDISISQAIYLLKESMIGFQRLYNRFGKFKITESMILLNEKYQCKVWLNEKLELNGISRCGEINQRKMVQKIIEMIYNHCTLTKNAMKLFQSLKTSYSFLDSLKIIQKFIHQTRMLVPKRFFCQVSFKQVPGLQTNYLERLRLSKNLSLGTRVSIRSVISHKLSQNSYSKFIKRAKSPNPIKRVKSDNQFPLSSCCIQVSDGEVATAYSPYSNSQNPETSFSKNRYERRWMEDSSFIMGMEDTQEKQQTKQKKQLTHSQAFFGGLNPALKDLERKYSVNTVKTNLGAFSSPRRLNKVKTQEENYLAEFALVFSDKQIQDPFDVTTPIDEEEEEQKIKSEHLKKVFQNNGWQNNIDAILASHQLKTSIHAGGGEQQKKVFKKEDQSQTKLSRLGGMVKRGVTMSILPEQYQDM